MEVMAASYAVATPQATTRSAPNAASSYQHYPAPASQDSVASVNSSTSSQGRALFDDSSNISQQTSVTDVSSVPSQLSRPHKPDRIETNVARARTPEDQLNSAFSLTSPMSLASPLAVNGTKRTASGHVKNASSYSGPPLKAAFSPRRLRAESTSSTGSRAGELAASLKMRLGYAMAKVQNGWETKNITELDGLARHTASQRYSVSSIGDSHRPMTAGYMSVDSQFDSSLSPPSKRRSGTFATFTGASAYSTHNAPSPRLDPPAEIKSMGACQLSAKRSHAGQRTSYAMSPPSTPMTQYTSRRPPVIRTDTQTAEAERDALQALTQLGSPHNSQFSRHHDMSQASSSQASPLSTGLVPMHRVAFTRGDSDSSAVLSGSDSSDPRRHLETR